ncbi:MAG: hypothetical protein ABJB12_20670 [Pseudomonadota bacterium]
MRRGQRWLCGLLLSALVAACETDHAALEKKPGGAGGAAGSGGDSGGAGGMPTQIGGGAGGQTGGHADDEPPGSNVFTILNGVVDAPRVVLCFAKAGADGSMVPFGDPVTDKPFEYGSNLVLQGIAGAKFDADTLQPLIIAGELDRIAGLGCEEAVARAQDEEALAIDENAHAAEAAEAGAANDAGAPGANSAGGHTAGSSAGTSGDGGAGGAFPVELPSRLRLRELPAIPAGTLSAGRSILYVATGCMGGFGYDGPSSAEYCGEGYTEQAPTLSAMLVSLSRRTMVGAAGIQFLHASLATPQVDLSSRPPLPSQDTGITLASGARPGQLLPHSANLSHPASEFGVTRLYELAILGDGTVLTAQPWTAALARGGVSALTDGVTNAVVLLGPRADHTSPTNLWNPSLITVIPVEGQ